MLRSFVFVIAGGIVGALAVWLLVAGNGDGSDSREEVAALFGAIANPDRSDSARSIRVPSVTEHLGVYRAAAATSEETLETSLSRLVGAPASAARDLEVDALLARLADLAPARAATLTLELGLETRFVVRAFQFWADSEAEAALNGLSRIENRVTRREVAFGLLDVLGDDVQGFDRIARVLPESERASFQVDRIERRAEYDVYGAFREAQSIRDPRLQRDALQKVAVAWAGQEPLGALGQAAVLPADARSMYLNAVSAEWARLDPTSLIAYIESGAVNPEDVRGGIQWLVAVDPQTVLRIANGMQGMTGRSLRMSAVSEMAAQDPASAIAQVDAMPPSQDRSMLQQQVASRFAMSDPRAALEWAQSLQPRSTDVINAVVQGIAQSDFELAADLVADPPPGVDPQLVSLLVSTQVSQDPEQAAKLADRLLAQDGALAKTSLSRMMSSWMQRNQEEALAWLSANVDSVEPAMVGEAAQAMARRDPAAAASYVATLPAHLRDTWIIQVAAPYANYDPVGATNWIAQYQGSQVYEVAYRQMVMQIAQNDPRAAGSMLRQASSAVQLGAASQVAMSWARQDPQAAVRWAEGLSDQGARAGAVGGAVSVWASTDPAAAKDWTLGLRGGESRDQALSSLLIQTFSQGKVDRSLLDAFSSDRLRQQALSTAIPTLARSDPQQAHELLDREVTDRNLKAQIEEAMQRLGIAR
jgi:hypothetical protein